MAKVYLVCRMAEVTYTFMANMGVPLKKGMYWYAPVFDKTAKVFLTKAPADAYCDKMNHDLKHPKQEGNVIHMDIAPYTDFKVIPIERA